MDINDIIKLINAVSESPLNCFKYEEDGVKLVLKKDRDVQINNRTIDDINSVNIVSESTNNQVKELKKGSMITSPMVGTFYSAPSEGAESYVSVGDYVKKGQIIGIVEAMKLMNEIESPYEGTIREILVKNKDMIGFGQELIRVEV